MLSSGPVESMNMQTEKVCGLLLFAAFLWVAPAAAQPKTKPPPPARLPLVKEIKDYPSTGFMTGCPNSYFVLPARVGKSPQRYVFLVRADGKDAWMNLDGRDTRLRLLKTEFLRKAGVLTEERYLYRAGATRIRVQIRYVDSEQYEEYPLRLTITLSKGQRVRRVRALGFGDC